MTQKHPNTAEPFKILLGGLGGDSHSVGLQILRYTLDSAGYQVHFLGTQNKLEDFFQVAALFNIVMISNMDGHARYYLRQFPEMLKTLQARDTLWYLGGHVDTAAGVTVERHFMDLGFDRVFFRTVGVESILETVARDLSTHEPKRQAEMMLQQRREARVIDPNLSDHIMEPETFAKTRTMVLDHWKTGHQARSMEENAAFLGRQASFVEIQKRGVKNLWPLIQPRSGVPTPEGQEKLFKRFAAQGADVLSYQVDSLTRNNNYKEVERVLKENRNNKETYLNGYPVVNQGVTSLRRIQTNTGVPLQTRHSTRDPRLLAEISYAGGVTSFEGGAITYNLPYYKDYPLDEAIRCWQYVDRLTGKYYEDFGIVLDREYFGTLTATLIPPSLAIVVNALECILSAQQGVRSVSVGYAEQGNRIQDIAAIRSIGRICSEVLIRLGYRGVQVNTVFHQYMAAFPPDTGRATELIYESAVSAKLSGATRIMVKTPVEAIRIPSVEDNCRAIDLVKLGRESTAEYILDEAAVREEEALIDREVYAILEAIVFSGGGSIVKGIVKGFEEGLIDVPFSPSIHNRGEVMTARDADYAVRFLNFGNLPFDKDLKAFHEEKIRGRRFAEGIRSEKDNYRLVSLDTQRIQSQEYQSWPLKDARLQKQDDMAELQLADLNRLSTSGV